MKDWKNYVLLLCALVFVALVSCGSLVDRVTPVEKPKRSAIYVGEDPNQGWFSQWDAKEMRSDIIIQHRDINLWLLRRAEDDKYAYEDAVGFITVSIKEGKDLQDIVIGDETHPVSIFGILGPLAGGALIGKEVFKRRRDYTPHDHETAVSKAYKEGVEAGKKTAA